MSPQNCSHARLGSSPSLTGVTMSPWLKISCPSVTRLKEPIKALSLGQGIHIHSHNEKSFAHKPAVNVCFPSGVSCSLLISLFISKIRSAVGSRKSTSPRASGFIPSMNFCPITTFSERHSCSSRSFIDTASGPKFAFMNPM